MIYGLIYNPADGKQKKHALRAFLILSQLITPAICKHLPIFQSLNIAQAVES